MKICANPPAIKPDLSRAEAIPALTIYIAALAAYQQQRTTEGRATLFHSYRQWIRSFLDDEGEVDRAANNFLIALLNQPREPQKMGVAA